MRIIPNAVLIVVASVTCLQACDRPPPDSGLTKVVASGDLEIGRRAAVFRQLYSQMKQHYVKDGVLTLPADIQEMSKTLTVHSSIDVTLLYHNPSPIQLEGETSRAMHTILLHDFADLGDGSSRVILFADGHVEVSKWQPAD